MPGLDPAPLRDTWALSLARWAEGFDLTDPEDRALFRGRVNSRTDYVRVDHLRDVARALGFDVTRKRSRRDVTRALSDGYIASVTRSASPDEEPTGR